MAQFFCALTCQISAKYPDVEMKLHTLFDPSAGKLKSFCELQGPGLERTLGNIRSNLFLFWVEQRLMQDDDHEEIL